MWAGIRLGWRNSDLGNKKYQTAGLLTNQPANFAGHYPLPVNYLK